MKNMPHSKPDLPLPESLVFGSDGHLVDLGIGIFADAEFSLLPESAVLHGESCEACARRIGELALQSASLRSDLRVVMAEAEAREKATAKFPTWAVCLASLVSAAAALPLFGKVVSSAHAQGSELAKSAPLAFRSVQGSLSTSGVLLVCVSFAAIAMCTLLGRRLLARTSA
ncbi:MAG: hypothetical protein U0174_19720 [Polyangiaceae bacterium]